jgi:hypothetical protein
LLFLATGCDVAKPEPVRAVGPDLHLVAMYPADGCGAGPDPTCTAPTNVTIALRFDRFLNPSTVNRQAIRVYTGDPDKVGQVSFEVEYDPVERVVEYRLADGAQLQPNALYHLEVLAPEQDEGFGIRAFDGAPLRELELPFRTSFVTGDGPVEVVREPAPNCQQIVDQVFEQPIGGCANGNCHAAFANNFGAPPHGLWLEGRRNFAATAIGKIARQTETGDSGGGVGLENSPRFGVKMPIVAPRNPGNSYLLYKLLRNPANYEVCSATATSPYCAEAIDPCESSHAMLPLADGECVAPTNEELDRLREWFVRGEPMPLIGSIGLASLRKVSRFIAAGANCSD